MINYPRNYGKKCYDCQVFDPEIQRLLWHLLAETRGGEVRARIIELLRERSYNINQLAQLLALNYKAVEHHMDVLTKNNLVVTRERYGVLYFLSQFFLGSHGYFRRNLQQVRPVEAVNQIPPKKILAKIVE